MNKPNSTPSETIEISLDPQTKSELDEYVGAKNWSLSEGYRIVLGAGLGYLRSNELFETVQEIGIPQDQPSIVARLVRAESSLASMRFRMFELQKANHDWENSLGAIHNQNMGFRSIVKRQKQEIWELNQKMKEMEQQLADIEQLTVCSPRPDTDLTGAQDNQATKWWHRIFKRT
ncbi:hypothetical protein ADN00_18065 [Ornatilinea apprima]|uniref:Uncharacterized protein n=1 Tax=Ornatilinea apprima TaxID=1134406 RepID=A0A0N8GKK8_9CHLR|nr:hypothetical protein [Ornatilinea apprima]KPL69978.1 hypothetical protein ADN00_18065 [Ornatilinea apprima]